MIKALATYVLVCWISIGALAALLYLAPAGWEDENGYHDGEPTE